MTMDETALAATVTEASVLDCTHYEGYIDAVESGRIYGWALDKENPDNKLVVTVFHGDTEIGELVADRYREDLVSYTNGDGRNAFVLNLPRELWDCAPSEFYTVFKATNVPLLRGKRISVGVARQIPDDLDPDAPAGQPTVLEAETSDLDIEAVSVARADYLSGRINNLEHAIVGLIKYSDARTTENGKHVEELNRNITEPLLDRMDALSATVGEVETFITRIDKRIAELEAANAEAARLKGTKQGKLLVPILITGVVLLAALILATIQLTG